MCDTPCSYDRTVRFTRGTVHTGRDVCADIPQMEAGKHCAIFGENGLTWQVHIYAPVEAVGACI